MEKIEIVELDLNIARKVNYNKAKKNKFLPISINKNKLKIIKDKNILLEEGEIEFLYNKKLEIINYNLEMLNEFIDKAFLGEKEELLNLILEKAIEGKASDIHFEPYKEEVLIRFRVDGKLAIYTKILHIEYQKLLSKVKVLGNMDITERRRPQDGKAFIEVNSKGYDLRLSTIPIV